MNKWMGRSLFAASAVVVVACADGRQPAEPPQEEPTQLDQLDQLVGVWRQRGYARVLEITDTAVNVFDVTEVSCTPAGQLPLAEVEAAHERILGSETTFSWYQLGHFTRYEFDRLDALPPACEQADPGPEATFEALWHMFDENYAFFDVRGVDWTQSHETYRHRVRADTDDDELYQVLFEMLDPLDDGHVYLVDPAGARGFLSGSLGGLWESWAAQFPGDPLGSDLFQPRGVFVESMRDYVLDDVLQGQGQRGLFDLLHWGWLDSGVGYLNVHAMGSADATELTIPDMFDLIDETMEDVMDDLGGAELMVVDVRFNEGGRDTMGYAIAGWFTDERTLVSKKRAVFDAGWTETQDVYVEPRGRPFLGPVALLTSKNSISAAETFVIAMNTLPNVTSLGTPTYGVLSDILARQLPNGWLVGLSNEVYESPDGDVYEGAGVPPEILVPYDDSASYFENLDATLLAARALAPAE